MVWELLIKTNTNDIRNNWSNSRLCNTKTLGFQREPGYMSVLFFIHIEKQNKTLRN